MLVGAGAKWAALSGGRRVKSVEQFEVPLAYRRVFGTAPDIYPDIYAVSGRLSDAKKYSGEEITRRFGPSSYKDVHSSRRLSPRVSEA